MKEKFFDLIGGLAALAVIGYLGLTALVFVPYYNKIEENNSSTFSYVLFGERVSTIKAFFWPFHLAWRYYSTGATEPPMTESEDKIFMSVLQKSMSGPLEESDTSALKLVIKNYTARTGKRYTSSEIKALTAQLYLAAAYQDALVKSALLSWDNKKRVTVPEFNELFKKMEKGGRGSDQLEIDQLVLANAAANERILTDRSGRKFAFGRETIEAQLGEGENIRRNADLLAECFTTSVE